MSARANPKRDPFTFSLGGLAAKNSYAFVPAIANDNLSKAWDRKLSEPPVEPQHPIQKCENILARYFAHGLPGTF